MKKYEDVKSIIIRESIGEAVPALPENSPFEDISVLNICKKSGVGRTTCCRYYGNKTDIGQYYLRYSGAGLWCGIIHAAIERDFKESPEEAALQYQIALFKSFGS